MLAPIAYVYGVFSERKGSGLLPKSPFPVSSDVHIRTRFTIDVSI
jgi:hypothetical protein